MPLAANCIAPQPPCKGEDIWADLSPSAPQQGVGKELPTTVPWWEVDADAGGTPRSRAWVRHRYCSKAGAAIRFWGWQREWLSTEKSYPSSAAGLSRCICNIISLKGSAYKTQSSCSCDTHTHKGKKCPAFFDREGGKTL